MKPSRLLLALLTDVKILCVRKKKSMTVYYAIACLPLPPSRHCLVVQFLQRKTSLPATALAEWTSPAAENIYIVNITKKYPGSRLQD